MVSCGSQISSSPAFGLAPLIVNSSLLMLSTALSRIVIALPLVFAAGAAVSTDQAPRTLRVPVVGMQYVVASMRFEPLPVEVQRKCPTLADDENMRGMFWIYASAREGLRTYYLVGGYGIRSHPEAPTFPRYDTLDSGIVFRIDGEECVIFGDAKEVFETRYLVETPQPILQELAANLASRLVQLVGGKDALTAALRRQHLNPAAVSPELRGAFAPYTKK